MTLASALRTAVVVAALSLVAEPAFAEEPMVTVVTVEQPQVAKIFVTLDASSDLVVERMRGSHWDVVCTGICGELLPIKKRKNRSLLFDFYAARWIHARAGRCEQQYFINRQL